MRILAGLALMLFVSSLSARTAAEYLPADADPDPEIPTPESILGWDVGDWHVSHDQLVYYMQALAAASPRVSIKVIGRTHEQRPLLQLAITSENNQQNLDALRQRHLDGGGPLVVWLGYSVHGDEPSGSGQQASPARAAQQRLVAAYGPLPPDAAGRSIRRWPTVSSTRRPDRRHAPTRKTGRAAGARL